jgi:hypothetical protein
MSSHQEKPYEKTQVPEVHVVSDGEGDEEVVIDLEAVTRAAADKLERDLVVAKRRNERIARKQQEKAELLWKQKEEEEAREAQQKLDEALKAAKEKAPVFLLTCLP